MTRLLLDFDPLTGISHTFHMDEGTGMVTITAEQDAAVLIEANKAEYNEHLEWGEWRRVASIPMTEYARLLATGRADDQKAMKRWLNDSDNRHFRTRHGWL
jgi:hypothetical protein